jgi:ABC-type multidrug transport system fused ATPase/permease subunit
VSDFKQNTFVAVVGALVGAFVTAVVGWWLTLPTPTTLAYVTTVTSTGTDSTARSLVPNLSLRIGDEAIPAIHTHSIDIYIRGRYRDQAPVAIIFPSSARLFGQFTEAPTTLQTIACQAISNGMKCDLGRPDPRQEKPYKIQLATDVANEPQLQTTGQDVVLTRLEAASERDSNSLSLFVVRVIAVASTIAFLLVFWDSRRQAERFANHLREVLARELERREKLEEIKRDTAEVRARADELTRLVEDAKQAKKAKQTEQEQD